MGLLAAEEKARAIAFNASGRNDPCPCGSGQKFKRCHGSQPRPGAGPTAMPSGIGVGNESRHQV
jgi:hypothetical protein